MTPDGPTATRRGAGFRFFFFSHLLAEGIIVLALLAWWQASSALPA